MAVMGGLPRLAWQFSTLFLVTTGIRSRYYDLQITYGPSMLPTLAGRGEWVIVEIWRHRLDPDVPMGQRRGRLRRPLQKGDIVTLLRPDVLERRQTKRIVALEGDTVTYDVPYKTEETKTIVIPRGHVWVEGDHQQNSHDSKHYGPISINLIEGRVLCQCWPSFALLTGKA